MFRILSFNQVHKISIQFIVLAWQLLVMYSSQSVLYYYCSTSVVEDLLQDVKVLATTEQYHQRLITGSYEAFLVNTMNTWQITFLCGCATRRTVMVTKKAETQLPIYGII